jgi:hypothetical protein
MKQVKIVPEPTHGKGWARLTLADCDSLAGAFGLCIIRPRHQESFLGPRGWTGSESRLHIELEPLEGSEVSLLLSPAIVQYLTQGDNYQFKIYDRTKKLIDECGVRWYGVAYRAPSGNQSPIEISLFDEMNLSETNGVTLTGLKETPSLSPSSIDEPTFSSPSIDNSHSDILKNLGETHSLNNDSYSQAANEFSSMFNTESSANNDNDSWNASQTKNSSPTPYPERKAAVRIKCKGCGYEIVAGWLKCPFCLTLSS